MYERELSLAVVGVGYPNADKAKSDRKFEMLLCRPGDRVELRREPKNKHDGNAVAVFSERGIQIGYLTADRAPWIGGKLAAAEECVALFQAPGATSAVIRIRFGGGPPTLPLPQTKAEHANDDFFADPEGPEWGA